MKQFDVAAEWVYQGVWSVFARFFLVPGAPPTLPALGGRPVESFRPSLDWLRYLKLQFWIGLTVIDVLLVIGWIAITVAIPWLGILLAPLAIVVVIVPDVVAYVALHLRYDTTWYVLSDRSLRIRRGIWVIQETTITFENVQNVLVSQGPLQRMFGIADVVVKTAGGAGHGVAEGGAVASHVGLLEGLANAPAVRDLILRQLRQSKSAGLGDEGPDETAADIVDVVARPSEGWSPGQLQLLREIRDAARRLADAG